MATKKIIFELSVIASALLLFNCNSNIFKNYFKNSNDKGIYVPGGNPMPDAISPDISWAAATSHTNIRIVFFDQSGKLDPTSAASADNYRVQGQSSNPNVPVLSATLDSDNLTVNLTLAAAPGMIHATAYTLVVNNVADVNNNAISTKTFDFSGRGAVAALLSGTPENPTNTTSTDISVRGDDIVSYKYKVGAGIWSDEIKISDRIQLTGLSDSTYTLYVIGKDSLNNWQPLPSPTTHTWTVDTVAPTVILSGTPPDPTNQTGIDIIVGGVGVSAYKYRCDSSKNFTSANVMSAGTLITETDFTDGPHFIEVIGRDLAGNWQSIPTRYEWTVDTMATRAEFINPPAVITKAQDASIQIGGAEVIEYAYKIDGGAWMGGAGYPINGIEVSERIELIGLSEGPHTIEVIGRDRAGNWQQNEFDPTRHSWTIDTTPPTAVFVSKPPDPDSNANPIFTVGGDQVVSFRYSIDGSAWSGLIIQTTPVNLSGLAQGPHTINIVGRDQAGNEQLLTAPTGFTWTIDLTPPSATLSGTPANLSNSRIINITVAGLDVQAYMYKIDSEEWSAEIPISAPISRAGLKEGPHTLRVVGKDSAGNWQAFDSATTHSWSIDFTASIAVLNNTPPDPTNQTGIDVIVGGTDVVFYSYSLDGGTWSTETAVANHIQLSGLSQGGHILYVIGRDSAGNWQAANISTNHSWEIDLSVPTALLSNTPPNPTNQPAINIDVGGTNVVSYKYKLDSGSWSEEIDAGNNIVLSGLPEGPHAIYVAAKNAAGTWQADGSATTYTWIVDRTPPGAVLTGTPPDPANYNTTDITVGGPGVAYYQYRIDGSGWSGDIPVATHIRLSGLAETSHALYVSGRDAAGNYQATPTSFTWVVDITPPAAPSVNDTGVYDPDGNLDFSWINGGDVAEVRVQIATDSGFASVAYGGTEGASVGPAGSYTYTILPSNGPRYYARVKARDSAHNWSDWGMASNGIDVVGGISGKVRDTLIQDVSGALVTLKKMSGLSTVATTTTNSNGDFTFNNVPIGGLFYDIDVSMAGYYNSTKTNITVGTGAVTDIGVVYIVATTALPGTIIGRSVDANNGADLGNMTVDIYDWSGSLVQSLTTNASDGTFTSAMRQPGAYTLVFSGIGYFPLTVDNIIVNGNTGDTTNTRYALCEILTEPHLRVVVQWGSSPTDLDLHVVGPTNRNVTSDGTPYNRFHVYYSNQKSFDENKTGNFYSNGGDPSGTSSTTSLVQDTTRGYGPEAINLFGFGSGYAYGMYTYTVHKYSSGGTWYDAPVTMRIFDSQGLVMQLSAPTGAGTLRYWQAIKINIAGTSRSQRTIQVQNTFNTLDYRNKSSMNW